MDNVLRAQCAANVIGSCSWLFGTWKVTHAKVGEVLTAELKDFGTGANAILDKAGNQICSDLHKLITVSGVVLTVCGTAYVLKLGKEAVLEKFITTPAQAFGASALSVVVMVSAGAAVYSYLKA